MDTTKSLNKEIALTGALLLYGESEERTVYCTHNRVVEDGNGVRLGEGVPVSVEALERLALALGRRIASHLLHERVLAWGQETMTWWTPSAQRCMFFNTEDAFLKDRKGLIPYPTLIFKRKGNGWKVCALKTNSRPTADDHIYHCPFLNIDESGSICTGTAMLPAEDLDNPEAWESAFFESRFTHSNFAVARQVKYEGSIYKFWADMVSGKFKSFPESVLIDTGKTVADFISG